VAEVRTCPQCQVRYQYKSTQFGPVKEFQAQLKLHGMGKKILQITEWIPIRDHKEKTNSA
jgi:hypothetical protein